MVVKQEIISGLRELGIEPGQSVLAHSSLKSLGKVEGGPSTVCDALVDVVGADGHVLMPTFTWAANHDKTSGVFDVRADKSEVGIITETFRLRDDVTRSEHFCHSFAASGKRRLWFLGDATFSCGESSPFERLYENDGWNLFLGVTFTTCTALHAVEERAKVPYRSFRDYKNCQIKRPDGSLVPSNAIEFLRTGNAVNDFTHIESFLRDKGVLREGKIGDAKVLNVRIRDLIDLVELALADDADFLLKKV